MMRGWNERQDTERERGREREREKGRTKEERTRGNGKEEKRREEKARQGKNLILKKDKHRNGSSCLRIMRRKSLLMSLS